MLEAPDQGCRLRSVIRTPPITARSAASIKLQRMKDKTLGMSLPKIHRSVPTGLQLGQMLLARVGASDTEEPHR